MIDTTEPETAELTAFQSGLPSAAGATVWVTPPVAPETAAAGAGLSF